MQRHNDSAAFSTLTILWNKHSMLVLLLLLAGMCYAKDQRCVCNGLLTCGLLFLCLHQVGSKKVDCTPPEGMVARKWGE